MFMCYALYNILDFMRSKDYSPTQKAWWMFDEPTTTKAKLAHDNESDLTFDFKQKVQ